VLDTSCTGGYEGFFEGTLYIVGAEGVERFEVPLIMAKGFYRGLI
jgi:hypothetical protein